MCAWKFSKKSTGCAENTAFSTGWKAEQCSAPSVTAALFRGTMIWTSPCSGKTMTAFAKSPRRSDPEYPLFFAKVRKNNTFIDEAKLDCFNIHKGIFIDIFPVDKMPKTTAKIKRHRLYLWFLFRLYFQTGKNTVPVSPFLSKPGLKFLLKSVKINKDKLYNYINKVYTKYNTDKEYDYTASWTMAQKFNWLYKKEWHESFIEVPFEDMTAKIPVGYDELLTNAYGDYMTPPPKEKQAPGHGLSFSTDVEGEQNE